MQKINFTALTFFSFVLIGRSANCDEACFFTAEVEQAKLKKKEIEQTEKQIRIKQENCESKIHKEYLLIKNGSSGKYHW